MIKIICSFLFIVCSFCTSMPLMGQNLESVRERANRAIKTRRPDLKLVRKEERNKEAFYNWGTANDGVSLFVFQGISRREAIDKMRATIKFLPAGPGKRRTDIGDEAYFWQDDSTGFAGFRFRKGNVFVDLVAPKDMAEDLARDLAQFVKKQ